MGSLYGQQAQLDALDSMIYNLTKATPPDIIDAVFQLTIRLEQDHPLAYQKKKTDREKDLRIVSWANHLFRAGVVAKEVMPLYEETNPNHKENTPFTVNEFVSTFRKLKNEEELDSNTQRSQEINERINKEKNCKCSDGWIITKKIDKEYKFARNHIIRVAIPCNSCYLGECRSKAASVPINKEKVNLSSTPKKTYKKPYNNNQYSNSYSDNSSDDSYPN